MDARRNEFDSAALAPGGTAVPAVVLHDVTVAYGAHLALSDITTTFPTGATGLLGANGAGKSTLILAILGLIEPAKGRIVVLGFDAGRSSVEIRARVGYVPERDASFPEMNAISSVAYCGQLAGLPAEDALSRADDVLSYVGLFEVRYRVIETLSTGLKQRLKVAQALVGDPDLLLLDEPTNGLDPPGRERMLDLIRDLGHRQRLNVIFSSHLLHDIERTCDGCVVLHRGRVVAAGAMGAWQPQADPVYEVRIRGDELAFLAALQGKGLAVQSAGDDEGTMMVTIPGGDSRILFVLAHDLRAQVRHVRRRVESLGEYFERVTGPTP